MIRFPVFLLVAALAIPARSAAQRVNQLDSNPALFAVMAAINAAGFDSDLDSTSNSPLRKRVRAAIAGKNLECMADLKKFVDANHQRDAGAELTQYISFALSIEGPPFKWRVPDAEIPPDVLKLRGFETIVQNFWDQAGLAEIWKQAQPEYDEAIAAYHTPLTEALLQATYYLKNPTSGYMGRRFVVYVELMGPPNVVQVRNYKDDYFVVVTPSPEPPIEAIRYSYLHYLLDPLALKYSDRVEKKKGLADFANAAPALEDIYKHDFELLFTTCLVKAVESRLTRGEAKRAEMVNQALREGFVFTPALADGLVEFEKQPMAMRLFYPELVDRIDLAKEEKRIDATEFTRERSVRRIKATAAPAPPELTGPAKTLETAEDLYLARKLDDARATFLRVLQETQQKPMHARAYYGLARIAALQKDPELAEKLFQKTLELSPDAETKGWSYVYLGKLALAAGERDDAARKFRDAITVEGASAKAKAEAKKGLDLASEKSK